MKKETRRSLLDDKRVLFPVCLLTAIVVWIIIAGFISQTDTDTRNASVNYQTNESLYKTQEIGRAHV